MVVDVKDIHIVLFALHLAAAQGTTLDPNGARTRALWDACVPLSLPEPTDPPLTETWRALVTMSEAYAQLANQPPGPRPTMIPDDWDAPVCGATWQ